MTSVWLDGPEFNTIQETCAGGKIQVSKANDALGIQCKASTSWEVEKHHHLHPIFFSVWSSDQLQENPHGMLL